MKRNCTLMLLLTALLLPEGLHAQNCDITLPWSQDFEGLATGTNTFPPCWTRVDSCASGTAIYPNVYSLGSSHGNVLNFMGNGMTSSGPLRAAIVLASSMGLRRGEICALTWADVHDSTLRVSRAYAKDEYNALVLKAPKSAAGHRALAIPPAATAVLARPSSAADQDRIVPLTPDALTRRFERLCDALQLHYRFHSLRHYYASVMLSLGVPDKYAMARMGHATPTMLKQVYQHLMDDKAAAIDDQLSDYFSGKILNAKTPIYQRFPSKKPATGGLSYFWSIGESNP